MSNCAPATGTSSLLGLDTTALIVTVSPGAAVFLSRTHLIFPSKGSTTSSSTMIAPFTQVILSVMSLPFVSLTYTSDHSTGYVPGAVGAVYLSVRITASFAALTPLPAPSPNANSGFLSFCTRADL